MSLVIDGIPMSYRLFKREGIDSPDDTDPRLDAYAGDICATSGCGRMSCMGSQAYYAQYCCRACAENHGHGERCQQVWPQFENRIAGLVPHKDRPLPNMPADADADAIRARMNLPRTTA